MSGSLTAGWSFPLGHKMWPSVYDKTTQVCDCHGKYLYIQNGNGMWPLRWNSCFLCTFSAPEDPKPQFFLESWRTGNQNVLIVSAAQTHDKIGVPNRACRVRNENRCSPSCLYDHEGPLSPNVASYIGIVTHKWRKACVCGVVSPQGGGAKRWSQTRIPCST